MKTPGSGPVTPVAQVCAVFARQSAAHACAGTAVFRRSIYWLPAAEVKLSQLASFHSVPFCKGDVGRSRDPASRLPEMAWVDRCRSEGSSRAVAERADPPSSADFLGRPAEERRVAGDHCTPRGSDRRPGVHHRQASGARLPCPQPSSTSTRPVSVLRFHRRL